MKKLRKFARHAARSRTMIAAALLAAVPVAIEFLATDPAAVKVVMARYGTEGLVAISLVFAVLRAVTKEPLVKGE